VSGAAPEASIIPEDPEDLKLITLARAARARSGAHQGAAVRDTDGRAPRALKALHLSGRMSRAPQTSRFSAISLLTG
jgi:hypothetical protein